MDEQLKKKEIVQLYADAIVYHLFKDVKDYRGKVEARRRLKRCSEK